MILYFTLSSWLTFILAMSENYDTRRPLSSKIRHKYRVKDDSILRKMIKFKDKDYYPCNYFKIIPIYVYLFIALFSLLLFLIDVLGNGFISKIVPDSVFLLLSIIVFGIYILYFLVVLVWWEIVDYKEMKYYEEMKYAKEGKAELRRSKESQKTKKK